MQKVIILQGLPGSGKTTYAYELIDKYPGKYKRINKDDLRAMLDHSQWSKKNEKFVLHVRDGLILDALELGYDVIVDDTNFNPVHIETIKKEVEGLAEVEVKFINISLAECISRDTCRVKKVGEKVIREMADKYLSKPSSSSSDLYIPNTFKRKAVIFDIDGTLALNKGTRSPFDWHRVGEDTLNFPVYHAYELYQNGEYDILIFSGRDSVCRSETITWLESNGIKWNKLFMRAEKDNRKDSIVKKEFFDQVRDEYNIEVAYDDRLSVCRMWHKLGVPLFRVGDPDADF